MEVTNDTNEDGHVVWSPDGRQIVFNNARSGEILLADQTDGKAWTVRATGVSGVHPIFSPDGRWIYAGTTKNLIRFSGGSGFINTLPAMRDQTAADENHLSERIRCTQFADAIEQDDLGSCVIVIRFGGAASP